MPLSLQRTPLFDLHRECGARIVPFAGWEMPVQFSSIIDEHLAVRSYAGLFDVSHMGEITVKGPEAAAFLNVLLTNDVRRIHNGKALYSLMCYEDGGVVDDLIVYQRDPDDFLLVVNAANVLKDLQWICDHAVPFDCTVRNASADWAQLALQGPAAIQIAESALDLDLAALKRFHFLDIPVQGHRALISRTGYTGEDGLEFYVRPEFAEALARTLLQCGSPLGLKPIGLGARDSLRLEAAFPLYGHEISEAIDPITARLQWAVKLNKPAPFIGQQALAAAPTPNAVFHFTAHDRRIPRQGSPVTDAALNPIGSVLSGTHSPTLNAPIGSALVPSAALNDPANLRALVRNAPIALSPRKPYNAIH